MRRITQTVFELEPEAFQSCVFFQVSIDHFLADAQDFRLHPGRRFIETGEHDLAELPSFLGLGNTQVLIRIQAGVGGDASGQAVRIGNERQRLIEVLSAIAERAPARFDLLEACKNPIARLLPGLEARIDLGQIPGVLRMDLGRVVLGQQRSGGRHQEK